MRLNNMFFMTTVTRNAKELARLLRKTTSEP